MLQIIADVHLEYGGDWFCSLRNTMDDSTFMFAGGLNIRQCNWEGIWCGFRCIGRFLITIELCTTRQKMLVYKDVETLTAVSFAFHILHSETFLPRNCSLFEISCTATSHHWNLNLLFQSFHHISWCQVCQSSFTAIPSLKFFSSWVLRLFEGKFLTNTFHVSCVCGVVHRVPYSEIACIHKETITLEATGAIVMTWWKFLDCLYGVKCFNWKITAEALF